MHVGDDVVSLGALGRALLAHGYVFSTVTPATHRRVNARPGNQIASTLAGVFGWSRPAPASVFPTDVFIAGQAAGVLIPHHSGWLSTVRAATLNGTLLFHSAYPTSEADAVFFGPDTYRFVSALSAHLLRGQRVDRAVDIGCGAGPGAIVIASARPRAEVIGVDINDAALRLTAVNAALAGITNVQAVRSDLLSAVDGTFDLIVANPPYLVDPEERTYRHGGGGLGEGLSLAIAELACRRLAQGGTLLLYTGAAVVDGGDGFRGAVMPLLEAGGLEASYEELDPDVFGEELAEPAYSSADRIAAVLVTATRP